MTSQELTIAYNNNINKLVQYYNAIIYRIIHMRLSYRTKVYYINLLKGRFYKESSILNTKFHADMVGLIDPSETIQITKNKKALLIGINYTGTEAQLNGCINDTNSIGDILTSKYDFTAESISKITDETAQKPTRDTILSSFKAFIESGQDGDLLFFSYSGHGSSTIDRSNDENDGKDEMIVTSDLKGILDDELKAIIQTHLKKNVTLFALFDCCFSGTVLDLKYQYLDSLENNNFTQNSNETETYGNVIMISGCNDNQTSADASLNGKYQGAMTWAFLSTLNSEQSSTSTSLSWKKLLTNMRDQLKTSEFTQLPQLSSGCLIDIDNAVCF
jgi:metacaspase-1